MGEMSRKKKKHRRLFLRNNGNNEERRKGVIVGPQQSLGETEQMISYKTYTFSKISGKLNRI